jgi:hypothetical protein
MFTPFTQVQTTFWMNYVLAGERQGIPRETSLGKIEAKYGPDNLALVVAALAVYDAAQEAAAEEV